MIPGHRTFKQRSETRGKSARGRQHFRSPENSQGRPGTHEISGRTAFAPRSGRADRGHGRRRLRVYTAPPARPLADRGAGAGREVTALSVPPGFRSPRRPALRPAARQVSADLRDAWAGLWSSCGYEPSTHGAGRREGRAGLGALSDSEWLDFGTRFSPLGNSSRGRSQLTESGHQSRGRRQQRGE